MPNLPITMMPLLALLTACGTDPVVVKPAIPAALLTCRDRPPPPVNPTNAQVADFILDLAAYGDECHDRLGRVKELLK